MTAVGGSPPTRRCPATEDRAPATVATPSSTDPTASRAVSWWSVHEYVAPTLAAAVEWPMAGTPAWCDLDDTDPVKWAAICDAARHWALRVETCQAAWPRHHVTYPPPPTGRRSLGRSSVGVTPTFGGWWSEMADIPYGRDYPDPIWCDEDGQPMPPVGAELLDDIRAFLRRFVVYPSDHELIAHTLWIAHCWFMEAWDSTPRIAFLSPEPGSGKSRALEVTEPLVPRPVHAINCTPAYLFRRVADPVGRPTVLYDECDTLFGPKAKEHEEIRGVINAGHRKGAVAGRCVIRGKIVETEELPAYCAVALAGLDDLPDTIMSRSIVVRMRRRAPTEPVEPWRPRVNGPEAEKLHDRLANWAAAINPLESGWPAMPDGVTDRRADVWESLVAVADTAGGHWPKTARATAETDATANRGAKPSIGVLLLRDIRRVFSDRDRMRTSDILTGLNRMEEGPWGSIRRGDPLDARGLATRLGRYGIGPKFQHSGGEPPYKGYSRTQFEDAWSRYLSADDETPEERDLSVSAVSAVSPPVGDPGDATGATDATDLPEAGDLPYEPPAPNGHPNGDAPLCSGPGCPNKLLSTEAKAAGKCRPCRGRAAASARDGAR
ncbi:phiRv2 phage protein [Mycobacterium tuberculosis]|nr:phiRv2 phage protein [Mycobacterium tuberculosis]